MAFLVSTVAACLLSVFSPGDSLAVLFSPMTVNALFLMTSSHHQRRPPSSRAPGSGPSTSASPQHESNTKRRRRESRSASPLIVFYGMVLGRPGYGTERDEHESSAEETQGSNNISKFDNDFFTEEMIQRKREFQQRYDNFRGRGRWGGYSLVALQHDKEPERAPLPVVSTTKPTSTPTSVAPAVRKSMKEQHTTRGRGAKRAAPILQIEDIQQYKEEVVDSTDSSLVVVRFYASWCKACKAIESNYHRLSQEFPSSVKFVEVPLTKENAYLHKGLGVPSLPFAHVYYNNDHIDNNGTGEALSSCRLVDELKINKNKFPEFKRILRSYVDQECDVHYRSKTNNGMEESDDDDDDDDTITAASTPQRRQSSVDVPKKESMETKTS
eukprot:CAMPEP_0116136226 /NCGR_PEP_ID=MMETSP0329-20121206/11609_1 /TAXON_ID=697910 /ORGANISM="Pseudo-nitzschia arenysensis, Strain B593" /LENGTH=383 /DNA_ID=CAMNT_0003631075 /DNA_START=280 /DNA_END=1431 /DNA_ORIENTATION=-